ncbi:hypothetical protein [Ichthyenterobacterium magnum]|uniref:Uncharacterized protein n=1 Tax=Ichthyenterobacterium magnum TaxID=1230530 RepID=A0A420DM15_9FLAO|nr:hypothetical protein [Ichthyenterobacterium magnum]RKE95217.1 hypothetical protein BXY80_1403 [Ichthyenterobacterium magnum]
MTREKRDKICESCNNHIIDERYGLLCGLTNNFANFQDKCKDYNASVAAPSIARKPIERTTITKKKEKKGFGSVIGTGIVLWIVFKIVLKLIKSFSE